MGILRYLFIFLVKSHRQVLQVRIAASTHGYEEVDVVVLPLEGEYDLVGLWLPRDLDGCDLGHSSPPSRCLDGEVIIFLLILGGFLRHLL